jgi:small neutral amino acid transporter SnatA (MarC family)
LRRHSAERMQVSQYVWSRAQAGGRQKTTAFQLMGEQNKKKKKKTADEDADEILSQAIVAQPPLATPLRAATSRARLASASRRSRTRTRELRWSRST